MEKLKVSGVDAAIKVGDTVADIKEGKSAGLISVGIVEGSSIMGLSEEEYEGLSEEEKNADINRVKEVYKNCGADYVIMNMSELIGIIDKIESESERR
jgi:phosphonoacetaldehyde hydrolase